MISFKHSSGLVGGLVTLKFTCQRLGKMHLIELPSEEVVYLRACLCLWFNFAGCTWSCSLVYKFEMVSEAIMSERMLLLNRRFSSAHRFRLLAATTAVPKL